MTKQDMIDKLNGDLANEYKHMLVYLHFSSVVSGLHREELSEFWMEAAKSEMQHVAEFSKIILGLGGEPLRVPPYTFPYVSDPLEQVKCALAMEEEVVENYVQRLKDATDLYATDRVSGTVVGLFLEEQIMDSRTDADSLREMAKQKTCY